MDKVRRRTTITDVAKLAGVSKTTISRYLNGKFEFMSAESKKKIASVIEELNYRPNNLARSLKSNKSRLIGAIISDISSPFSSILLKGISDCCKKYGYSVMIANTDDDPRKEREYILSMIDQQVDGLIINTTGKNNDFLKEISKNHIPIILADRPIPYSIFDTVRTNDVSISLETLQYLADQGYTKVGFFSEPINSIGSRIYRQQAYYKACETIFHIEPQEYILESKDEAFMDNLIKAFIENNSVEKKAIFTANGIALLNVLHAIKRLNVRFPEDLGICGFDDWYWTGLIGNGITAISQPSYKVGMECVKRVMHRIYRNNNAAPKLIELACKLVIRGST